MPKLKADSYSTKPSFTRRPSINWMVNLTTLAPDIIAAIPDEPLPDNIMLPGLAADPPALWEERQQREIMPIIMNTLDTHSRSAKSLPSAK